MSSTTTSWREIMETGDAEPIRFGGRRPRGHRLEASGLPDRQYDAGGGGPDY